MSGLLYAGFDYGTTADLPGASWTTASDVTIVEGAGRANGGAAFFDAALASKLSATLTWTGTTAQKAKTFIGFAFRPLDIGTTGATIAQLVTDNSTYTMKAFRNGTLELRQDALLLQRVGPVFSLDNGAYIEWGIELVDADSASLVSVRVNGKFVLRDIVGTSVPAEAFESFALGGGATQTGTWYVDDVYVLDGAPKTAFATGYQVVDNANFLGDIRVEALFPAADGLSVATDLDYTPWTPSSGSSHYLMVNEQPPDGGSTNESTTEDGTYDNSTHTLDKYDTFEFQHHGNGISGFGQTPSGDYAPLFAVQVLSRLSTDAPHVVRATTRVVENLPSTDYVNIGATRNVTDPAYTYVGTIFDRDPSVV